MSVKQLLRLAAQSIYRLCALITKKDCVTLIYSKNSIAFENLPVLAKALELRGVKYRIIDSKISLKNIYLLSQANVVCLDQATYLTSNLRMCKSVKVVQLWHAGGAYKKVGYDACNGTIEDRERIDRIHGNVDWIITSSINVKGIYAKAFALPEERVLPLGMLRTDVYFSTRKKSNSGRVILFAPTFRTNSFNRRYTKNINSVIDEFERLLTGTDYELAIRLHPSVADAVAFRSARDWSSRSLIECLSEASVLVTDYSSILFDYSLFDGRIFWYIPDHQSYETERGLYFDPFDEYPEYSSDNLADLIKRIKSNRINNCKLIRRKYMDACDGESARRICNFIQSLL